MARPQCVFFSKMKKIMLEILFILILSLIISLIYNTASPTGIKIIKDNKTEIKGYNFGTNSIVYF